MRPDQGGKGVRGLEGGVRVQWCVCLSLFGRGTGDCWIRFACFRSFVVPQETEDCPLIACRVDRPSIWHLRVRTNAQYIRAGERCVWCRLSLCKVVPGKEEQKYGVYFECLCVSVRPRVQQSRGAFVANTLHQALAQGTRDNNQCLLFTVLFRSRMHRVSLHGCDRVCDVLRQTRLRSSFVPGLCFHSCCVLSCIVEGLERHSRANSDPGRPGAAEGVEC